MKIKFSKKLKWLGIGAGLAVLTTAAVAPVLVSCSNNDSNTNNDQNNGGGNNTPGQGNQGSGDGQNGQGSNQSIVTGTFPTIDLSSPEQVLGKGAISNGCNILSIDKTLVAGYSDNSKKVSFPAGSTNTGGALSGVESFTSYQDDKGGVSLSLVLNEPLDSFGFGQYNPTNSPVSGTVAPKFLFGNSGAGISFLNQDWLTENNVDTTSVKMTWSVDNDRISQYENEPTYLKLATNSNAQTILTGGGKAFSNYSLIDWKSFITNSEQNQDITLTGYVKLTIEFKKLGSNTNNKAIVPINYNVTYRYVSEANKAPAQVFNTSKNAQLNPFNQTTATLMYDQQLTASGTTNGIKDGWSTNGIANAVVLDTKGSDLTNNVINFHLGDHQEYIRTAIDTASLTPETLINSAYAGSSSIPLDNSIISKDWLVDNKFLKEDSANKGKYLLNKDQVANRTPTKINIGWSLPNNGSHLQLNFAPNADGGKTYIYQTQPFSWANNSTQTLMSSRATIALPKYEIYDDYDVTMTVSLADATGNIQGTSVQVPVIFRFSVGTQIIENNAEILKQIPDAIKLGNKKDSLNNANALENSVAFENGKLNIKLAFDPNVNQYIALKNFTSQEFINNILNKNYLEQNGFTNPQISWTQSSGTDQGTIQFESLGGTNSGSTINLVLNSDKSYYVSDVPINDMWLTDSSDTKQNVTFTSKLLVTDANNKELKEFIPIDISIAPTCKLTKALTSSKETAGPAANMYYSTNGAENAAGDGASAIYGSTEVSGDANGIQLLTGNKTSSTLTDCYDGQNNIIGINVKLNSSTVTTTAGYKDQQIKSTFFAFRLPNASDLIESASYGSSASSLLNANTISYYGLEKDATTQEYNFTVEWVDAVGHEGENIQAFKDAKLQVMEDNEKNKWIFNSQDWTGEYSGAGSAAITAQNGLATLYYTLKITKNDGSIINIPVSFVINAIQ